MGRGSCTSGPRSITPQASLYRWRTTDQELGRNSSSRYSIHYSLRNPAVWGWVWPSAGRSLRPMVAGYGLGRKNRRAPSFSLRRSLTVRRLLVLHEESNPTISRLIHGSESTDVAERSSPVKVMMSASSPRARVDESIARYLSQLD